MPTATAPSAAKKQSSITADSIMQLGLGFWGSKTLLSAVELGLFTELARQPMDANAIQKRFKLHDRATRDFLDALVALGMLRRNGATYSNAPETDAFLDRNKPAYVGGILEMCNTRLFGYWNSLTEALQSGKPQNESKHGGGGTFESVYSTPEGLETFLKGMTGISLPAANAIAAKFPWDKHKTFIDIGCAQGAVPVTVAKAHRHLTGGGFDLPAVKPVFEEYVKEHGLSDRLRFQGGDFFNDPLPKADVLIMGHILHDWDLPKKKALLAKAFEALPSGGALIVYEAIIDDERTKKAFGLLMSLNMIIETEGGFDYTGADCQKWMKETGFRQTSVEHLAGPDSMVVGVK